MHSQRVPVEAGLQFGQGLWLDALVDLNRANQSAVGKISL
jgi:hypothetical protein